MDNLSTHVGKRIRYYRKAKEMSISQLAERICKSKSSVSKYEHGEVALDIETLYEIAQVLDVSLAHLTDYSAEINPQKGTSLDGFFHNTDIFYMYCIYYGKPYESVLTIQQAPDGTLSASCYFDVKDMQNYYNCSCLYHGSLSSSYTHVNFHLVNEMNPADELSIIFVNLFFNTGITNGLLTSISERLIAPCSVKALLSKTQLSFDNEVKSQLSLSVEELRTIRASNMFVIERTPQK